jgi:hypothetical protein
VRKGNGKLHRDPASVLTPQERAFMARCLQAETWGILSDEAREICRKLIKKMEFQQNDLGGHDEQG